MLRCRRREPFAQCRIQAAGANMLPFRIQNLRTGTVITRSRSNPSEGQGVLSRKGHACGSALPAYLSPPVEVTLALMIHQEILALEMLAGAEWEKGRRTGGL